MLSNLNALQPQIVALAEFLKRDWSDILPIPILHSSVWPIFFKNSLGILLTNFNNTQILTKDAVNHRSRGNQKNSCSLGKFCTNKPETQWFCVHKSWFYFKKYWTQNEVPLFFWCAWDCAKGSLLDWRSALGTLALQSTMPPRHRAEKKHLSPKYSF